MPAGIYTITVEQGATYSQTFIWKIDKNPVDLSGWEARMQVRKQPQRQGKAFDFRDNDLLLSLTSEDEDITLDGVTGKITIDITPETTKSLKAGVYNYDLEMVSSSTEVVRLLKGTFVVDPEVTN